MLVLEVPKVVQAKDNGVIPDLQEREAGRAQQINADLSLIFDKMTRDDRSFPNLKYYRGIVVPVSSDFETKFLLSYSNAPLNKPDRGLKGLCFTPYWRS